MLIESEVRENEPIEKNYPLVKRYKKSGLLVLFNKPGEGLVLSDPSGTWVVGHYSTGWSEECYEVWHGTIKLSV